MFPEYHGPPLLGRELDFYGGADDAQILDQQLFRLLRNGFNLEVTFAGDGETPNVIFTAPHEEDYEWPTTVEEAANFWVVVIDYHD
ncbi:MAG: hypothetical protein HZA93_06485 [Verrucomicrobia bacterium]|nr:hypothetical protein [Verrucomicrobiota bacterium]